MDMAKYLIFSLQICGEFQHVPDYEYKVFIGCKCMGLQGAGN